MMVREFFRKDDDELVWGIKRQPVKDLLWMTPIGLLIAWALSPYVMILSIPVFVYLMRNRWGLKGTTNAVVALVVLAPQTVSSADLRSPAPDTPYMEITVCASDAQDDCDVIVAIASCVACFSTGSLCLIDIKAMRSPVAAVTMKQALKAIALCSGAVLTCSTCSDKACECPGGGWVCEQANWMLEEIQGFLDEIEDTMTRLCMVYTGEGRSFEPCGPF